MDIALKQRLVGASVLIALAVVVVPMLLGGRPDPDSMATSWADGSSILTLQAPSVTTKTQ